MIVKLGVRLFSLMAALFCFFAITVCDKNLRTSPELRVINMNDYEKHTQQPIIFDQRHSRSPSEKNPSWQGIKLNVPLSISLTTESSENSIHYNDAHLFIFSRLPVSQTRGHEAILSVTNIETQSMHSVVIKEGIEVEEDISPMDDDLIQLLEEEDDDEDMKGMIADTYLNPSIKNLLTFPVQPGLYHLKIIFGEFESKVSEVQISK